MLTLSDEALKYMKGLLAQEDNSGDAIRIGIVGGGRLGVLVDYERDDDERYERDGVTLIVDRNLLSYCKAIDVQFTAEPGDECGKNGYIITTENPL